MTALPSPAVESRLARAWSVVSDLLLATAVIWCIPLLLGAAAAVFRLLF